MSGIAKILRRISAAEKRARPEALRPLVVCVHYLSAPDGGVPNGAPCVCDEARAAGKRLEIVEIEYVENPAELFSEMPADI